MSRFSKKLREMPELNTSSLPDLIFTLLFFFMITTSPRHADLKIDVTPPELNELSRIENKSSITYIYVGKSSTEEGSGNYVIQINDRIASMEDVRPFLEGEKKRIKPTDRDEMIVSLNIDKSAPMGIVSDVKLKMREANTLLVNYAAIEPQK